MRSLGRPIPYGVALQAGFFRTVYLVLASTTLYIVYSTRTLSTSTDRNNAHSPTCGSDMSRASAGDTLARPLPCEGLRMGVGESDPDCGRFASSTSAVASGSRLPLPLTRSPAAGIVTWTSRRDTRNSALSCHLSFTETVLQYQCTNVLPGLLNVRSMLPYFVLHEYSNVPCQPNFPTGLEVLARRLPTGCHGDNAPPSQSEPNCGHKTATSTPQMPVALHGTAVADVSHLRACRERCRNLVQLDKWTLWSS